MTLRTLARRSGLAALSTAALSIFAPAQAAEPPRPAPEQKTVLQQRLRPAAERASVQFERALQAENDHADATLATLRKLGRGTPKLELKADPGGRGTAAPPPADCDRRVLKVGQLGSGFTLRPGQLLVIRGCFQGAPVGSVRMNGLFQQQTFRQLDLLEWTDTYIRARVPNLVGVLDQDVRVQLRFGDGDFSNELEGSFIARRALYVVDKPWITLYVDYTSSGPGAKCGWRSTPNDCHGLMPGVASGPGSVGVKAGQPALGSHQFKGRQPYVHVAGYWGSLARGTTQFSNWGPNGELVVDWATGAPNNTSLIHFEKFLLEMPVGVGGHLTPYQEP